MPELPEIEVVLRQLKSQLTGAILQSISIGREDIIRCGLKSLTWYVGSRIKEIQRHGKSISIVFEKRNRRRYFVIEMGMTGLLLFERSSIPNEKHVHMVMNLLTKNIVALYYWNARRFGRLHLLNEGEWRSYCERRFGVDPLSVKEDEFVELVKIYRGRVKGLLLHQQRIAGIGNIYANEMLFRAGIHPHFPANRLSKKKIKSLFRKMHELLREAIDAGGSSVRDFIAPDGTSGKFQEHHQVYQKNGMLCRYGCQTLISRLATERSSFFCQTCQKL